MTDRRHMGQEGLVPLARNSGFLRSTGWKVMKWSAILFTVAGFLTSFSAMAGSGGITLNGQLIEGWRGVWIVTGACLIAGLLFGAIWLLIFKTLALASKG